MNDGGPAFPATYDKKFPGGLMPGSGQIRSVSEPGMSLRDYFAAQTMPALIGLAVAHAQTATTEILKSSELARAAYEAADALLAERAK